MIRSDVLPTVTVHPPTGLPFELTPLDFETTFDQAWSPYGQISLTVATPPIADFARLNPKGAPVRITLTALSAPEVGPPTILTADLVLRDRQRGQRTGETVLDLHTDESLLIDYPLVSNTPEDVGLRYGTTARALAGAVLDRLGFSLGDGLTASDLFSKNLAPNPSADTRTPGVAMENLHRNPTPALNLVAWSAGVGNTTIARTTAQTRSAWSGSSVRAAGVAAGAMVVVFANSTTDTLPVAFSNEEWVASVYIRPQTTLRNWTVSLRWFDDTGAQVGADDVGAAFTEVSGQWTRAHVTAFSPAGATRVLMIARTTANVAAGEGHYLDGVQILGPVNSHYGLHGPYLYFDGGEAPSGQNALGVAWAGVPSASKSILSTNRPNHYNIRKVGSGGHYEIGRNSEAGPPLILGTAYVIQTYSDGATAFSPTIALDPVAVTPGYYMTMHAMVKSSRSVNALFRVRFMDAADNQISAPTSGYGIAPTGWLLLEGFPAPGLTVPAGAVTARIEISPTSSSAGVAGNNFQVHDLFITESPVPIVGTPAYFDGDTADTLTERFDWYSTPHDSVSVRNKIGTGFAAPDSAVWTPGQTAWDFLEPLLQYTGYRLWADEGRSWHLVPDGYTAPGTLSLTEAVNVYDYTDRTSRDADWWDAVIIEYRWTDLEGVSHTKYDTAATLGYTKGVLIQYPDTVYPGPGAAVGVLARGLARARTFTVEAANDYDARPSQLATFTVDGNAEAGKVAAISFLWPMATMSATIDNEG